MKLMFMFCNDCMNMLFSKSWAVYERNCTCIYLEEHVMQIKVIRRTFWTNGLVTDREMLIDMDAYQKFIDEQRRRFINGPGIDSVKIFNYRNRCYTVFAHEKVGQ